MTRDQLAEQLEELLMQSSHKLTKKLAKAIKKAALQIENGDDLAEILNDVKLTRDTERIIAEARAESERLLATEWDDAVEDVYDNTAVAVAGAVILASVLNPTDKHFNPRIADAVSNGYTNVEKTITNALKNPGIITKTPAFTRFEAPTEFYNRTVLEAITDIHSGRKSYEQVVKESVRTLTRSGMRYVNYESGHVNRVDVAVSRAVQTELSHIQGEIAMENARELGTEYFEVDWHAGARPEHAEWQGKVWSMKELEEVCGLGTVTGLKGANCYHQYFPFVKGISERQYTDAWLKEQRIRENTPVAYGGQQYTTYEARQKQRQMESAMRITRDKINTLDGLNIDCQTDKLKYTAQRRNYETFSAVMGEKTHYDRVYRDGLGRVI